MFENVVIKNSRGETKDESWLKARYGNIVLRKADGGMRVVELLENIGMAALQAMVLDEEGNPVKGFLVGRRWPYRDANPELPVVSESLRTWYDRGVEGVTKDTGVIGFSTGGGDFYSPSEGVMGASTIWTAGLSDAVEGLGVLREPGYPSMDVVFQLKGNGPPPPPDEVKKLILAAKAYLTEANLKLDEALRLLP